MEESQEVVQRAVALVLGSRGGGDTVTFQILRPGQVIGIQMTVVTTEVCDRSVSEARSLKFTLSTLSSDPPVNSPFPPPPTTIWFTAKKIGNLSVTIWKILDQMVSSLIQGESNLRIQQELTAILNYNLPKLIWDEINNLSSSIIINKTEFIV